MFSGSLDRCVDLGVRFEVERGSCKLLKCRWFLKFIRFYLFREYGI